MFRPVEVAQQPVDFALDCATAQGWQSIEITFDGDASAVGASDFTITVDPADVPPPTINSLTHAGNMITLNLNQVIPPGHWTMFAYAPSGGAITLGNLPGDCDGDGTAGPLDALRLIDFLNGVGDSLPLWSSDTDRSGLTSSGDVLRTIDILNGAGCLDPWNGVSLP